LPDYRAIPDPAPTVESLQRSVQALKETVEILTRQRRPVGAGAVTWQDLLDLELIASGQVPSR